MTNSNQKWLILISFIMLLISIALLTDPIPQDPAYHLLADTRSGLEIPNLADVISNLPFAMVGWAGLSLCLKSNDAARLSWQIFFIGLILVAAGSSYYHLNPNNKTLVWDRLPMVISFMSLLSALVVENISVRLEKRLLPIALALGLSSVIYWHYTDDLRFYAFIQFSTLAAIPIIFYRYKSHYTHRHYLLYGLFFYLLAKFFELTDKFIFKQSGQLLSGHTLKHLLAAVAVYCLYLMLKKRHVMNLTSSPP